MLASESASMRTRSGAKLPSLRILSEPTRPSTRADGGPTRILATDGPFAESKELVVGSWPATVGELSGCPGRGATLR